MSNLNIFRTVLTVKLKQGLGAWSERNMDLRILNYVLKLAHENNCPMTKAPLRRSGDLICGSNYVYSKFFEFTNRCALHSEKSLSCLSKFTLQTRKFFLLLLQDKLRNSGKLRSSGNENATLLLFC